MKKIAMMLILMGLTLPLLSQQVGILHNCSMLQRLNLILAFHFSKIYGESPSYLDPPGFHAGINTTVFDINKQTSFLAELNISMQGARYEDNYDGNIIKGKVELWYINFPLLIRFQSEKGFFGEAGIQPGFLLNAKDKYENSSHNYRDFINTFDFGIPIGGGYQLNEKFDIGLRIIPGISNINKDSDIKDHNLVIGLRATYRLFQ